MLTAGSPEDVATDDLVANFTDGIGAISEQVPTFFTIVAVVILLGFLAILVINARRAQPSGGGSL